MDKVIQEPANERTKLRLAKSEGFLYDTRTGHKVLEFGYNELGEQLNEVDADQIMESVNRDAPRGNADPNHLILTEEELNQIQIKGKLLRPLGVSWEVVEDVIASHRQLLSANAELSFKNAEQRKTIDHQHILLDKYESMLRECRYE
jgi:hypothetical protein